MTRVVIGEDNLIVRNGVEEVLASRDDIQVAGAAASYDELVDVVERERPDVVLTGIRMPPSHSDEGVRLASHLRTASPAIGVVLLSQYISADFAIRLFEHGSTGRGYLLKEHVATEAQLTTAVKTVASGGSVVDPAVVNALIAERTQEENPRIGHLTARELEVLSHVAEGKSNTAIGAILFLTKGAVEKHINSIFRKLGMPDETAVHRRVLAALLFLSEQPRLIRLAGQ